MLTLAHPAGLWALLALLPVVALHFLQRESRRLRVSTLFLLEPLAPESASGRRFERLLPSVPLWMQILGVLLLAWLLSEPRWMRRDSVQQVVLILDSSVSMSAFRPEWQKALENAVHRLGRTAATTEWRLLESDSTRPVLYSGADPARLLRAAEAWEPHLGTHDFSPVLANAQSLLHGAGAILLVTDRVTPLPAGVHLLAVGHPLENCGFSGAGCEGRHWQALLRNYGAAPQTRHWWIEADGQKSPAQVVSLAPGQSAALAGDFPAGVSACELVADSDSFSWDDRVPLVVAQKKRLTVAQGESDPGFAEFFSRLEGSLENSVLTQGKADLRLVVYDPFHPGLPPAPALVFASDPSPTKYLTGEIAAENHPFTEGLNWSGLLCRQSLSIPAQLGDRVLVWQGERPLLFLRPTPAGDLLLVNFDLRASNAARLPSFVLLLHRFAEEVRAQLVAPEARNVECHQLLAVASDPHGPRLTLPGAAPGFLRAPDRPAFFQVRQGTRLLLQGAAQFADVREADFRAAAPLDQSGEVERRLIERNSRRDFLTSFWLLALGAAMVVSWTWKER